MSTQLDTLNKRLLVALGLSSDTAQIVVDHIDELRSEAGLLRTEMLLLKQDLKDANLGRCTCSDCGKVVGNAWRDSDGHHCLTCLAGQRDRVRFLMWHRHNCGRPTDPLTVEEAEHMALGKPSE